MRPAVKEQVESMGAEFLEVSIIKIKSELFVLLFINTLAPRLLLCVLRLISRKMVLQ